MDALFAKGKEFLSSKEDKETSNHGERSKHHDDVDDFDEDRSERKDSDHHGGKSTRGSDAGKSTGGNKTGEGGAGHGAHNPNKHQQPTNSELMASAKLIAAAAQSQLGGGDKDKPREELDTEKLAGAAADLLAAASHYGKFGEEGVGKYIGQAEDYLHGYELKNSKPNKAGSGTGTGGPSKKSTSSTAEHRPGGNGASSRDDDYDEQGEHVRKVKQTPPKKHSSDNGEEDYDDRARGLNEHIKKDKGMPKKQASGHDDYNRSDEDDDHLRARHGKSQGMLKKKSGDGDESPRDRDGDSGGGLGGVMKIAQGMFKKDSDDHDRDRSPTRDSNDEGEKKNRFS